MEGSRFQDDKSVLGELCPAGFYLAVRVGFAFPEYELNTLPLPWVYAYTRDALMLYDPVTRWIYENTGSTRWSDIQLDDPRGVMKLAAGYDLNFGAAICVVDDDEPGIRTYGTFSRPDREFSDSEILVLQSHLHSLHRQEPLAAALTDAETETLAMIRDGFLTKQIAHDLGISESAVKQRLRSAKSKLCAKTSTHAVTLAERRGLFRMA